MGICENIQFLSKRAGLPISHLEKELSFANGSIRRWNESSPSIDKVQKVADYLKVSTEYLLLGFERTMLVGFINSIRSERSLEKFSEDTGIDINELTKICLGLITERPSLDIIDRIANSSINFTPQRKLDRGLLSRVAGYRTLDDIEHDFKDVPFEEKYAPTTIAAHHDGDEWTEEELTDIEKFKEFVRSKRNAKS